jgi:hypothetical protein
MRQHLSVMLRNSAGICKKGADNSAPLLFSCFYQKLEPQQGCKPKMKEDPKDLVLALKKPIIYFIRLGCFVFTPAWEFNKGKKGVGF